MSRPETHRQSRATDRAYRAARLHPLVTVALSIGAASLACSSEEARPGAGALGAACYPNGTCNLGLECVQATCEAAGDATDGDTGAPVDATTPGDAAEDATAIAETSDDATDAPDGADAVDLGCGSPCEHGGTCVAGTCDCGATGYGGTTCAEPICEPACQHGGICQSPHVCDCAETGHSGDVCQWRGVPAETNAWRIAYASRGRLPENASERDYGVIDPDGGGWWSIDGGLGALGCDVACVVSPDARWLAVVTGTDGYTSSVRLFALDSALRATAVDGAQWTDVADFAFAGGRFLYSRLAACDGPVCRYEVSAITPALTVSQPPTLFTFPPDSALAGSTFAGHFRVSPDGARIALLDPIGHGAELFVWTGSGGLVAVDSICREGTDGACAGGGSEYTDTDPMAFDAASRHLVLFTAAGREQQIRAYDMTDLGAVRTSVVASVASGAFLDHACDAGSLADWQWRKVIGRPTFTPDGEEVVFLTLEDCPVNGQPPLKGQTNIHRVPLATLLEARTLRATDVFDVTRHPKGDVTANRQTSSFSLSPDGATIVFAATPTVDLNGNPIPDGAARARNDQEIFRIRLDGLGAVQLTNDASYTVEWPAVIAR